MRLMFNAFTAAIAGSCLVVAACGDNSATVPPASASNAVKSSILEASVARTTSLNGTAIPTATQIVDSGGNVWTVSGGVVAENGASAGYSSGVTKLLYDGNIVYQENAAGGWWSWVGNTWVASTDPTKLPSPNGTSIPTVTQITDSGGNVWVVSSGVIYENGALAGYSSGVTALVYVGNILYQENAAAGWWSWNGSAWASSSNPTAATLTWTTPTQNTDGTPLTDLAGYTISYGTNPTALTQTIKVANPSATSYVVSNLSAGAVYFAIAAYSTAGEQSAESSEASKTIM